MAKYLPKTSLVTLSSLLLLGTIIIVSIGPVLRVVVYDNVGAGSTIIEDVYHRPILAILVLLGMSLGVFSLLITIFAITRYKERSLTSLITLVLSSLFVLFLLFEIIIPH